jgi:hypothetical protein
MLALGTSAQQIPARNRAEMTESLLEHRPAANSNGNSIRPMAKSEVLPPQCLI